MFIVIVLIIIVAVLFASYGTKSNAELSQKSKDKASGGPLRGNIYWGERKK